MRMLFAMIAASAALSSNSSVGHVPAVVSATDSIVIDFRTTVPGHEVAFTFLASATTAHLAASRISTRGDTVYAWTPARLTLPAHLEKVPIVVTTGQREPWLHAVVGLAQEVEAWGSEIHLIPGPGGLRLTANRVKWRASTSEAGRAVIGLMRK